MERFGHRAARGQQLLTALFILLMMDEVSELCFPQLLNTSCRKAKRPHTGAVLVYTLLYFISLVTATLNLLVIISISHFKQLHTPTNLLLLSLAVSDFLVGLLTSFELSHTIDCWFLGDFMCEMCGVLDFICTAASIGTMVLISVDRYVAICDPLHYSSKITLRRVTFICFLCWIWSVLYSILVLKDNLIQPGRYNSCSGECVIVINHITGLIDLILYFIVPVAVIVVLYMRVFVVAVSQARAMRSHITAVRLKSSVTVSAKKSELKAARTLGVVVVVFLSCLCPYYCFALVGPGTLFSVSSVPIVAWLFYFNSCLNPVIYAFCYPWFLRSVKLIVTFKIFQAGSYDANIL